MTLPEQMIRAELLNSRITRTNAVYARFYGPLCLLVISLTFFPYYESEPDSSISYGNLWQEVVRLGPGYDLMALLVLLLTQCCWPLPQSGKMSTSGLIAILMASTSVGSTLLQSPGYVDPPPYKDVGVFDIVLSFLTAGLVLAHGVHLFVLELAFQRGGV